MTFRLHDHERMTERSIADEFAEIMSGTDPQLTDLIDSMRKMNSAMSSMLALPPRFFEQQQPIERERYTIPQSYGLASGAALGAGFSTFFTVKDLA